MDMTVPLLAIGFALMLFGVVVVSVAAARDGVWSRPVGMAGFAVTAAGVVVTAYGAASVSVG